MTIEDKETSFSFDDNYIDADDIEEVETEEEEETEGDDNSKEESDDKESKTEDDSDDKSKDEDESTDKEAQKRHEKNEHYKQRRLERERKERELREAQIKEDAKKEAERELYKFNPVTGEKVENDGQLLIAKIQKQLEDQGKDAINDLPKALADYLNKQNEEIAKARKEAEVKERKEKEESERMKQELAEFKKSYPDVDTKALSKDDDFNDILDKYGDKLSFEDMYLLYASKYSANKKGDDKTKGIGKKVSKTPSSNPHGASRETDFMNMSDEEYENYRKANSDDYF